MGHSQERGSAGDAGRAAEQLAEHAPIRLIDVSDATAAAPTEWRDVVPETPPGTPWEFLPVVAYTCRCDDLWTCVGVIGAVEELVGVTPEVWVAERRGWLERVHPADREGLLVQRLTALHAQRPLSVEYRLRAEDGTYRWVRDEARFECRDGVPVFLHGVLTDVTARRHSDDVLAELYEDSRRHLEGLRRQLAEREDFQLLMAHDLRVYLDVVRSSLTTLRAASDDADLDLHQLADHALRGVERARGLIHDLIDLDRWSSHGCLRTELVWLPALVHQVLADIEAAEHRIEVDVAPHSISVDPIVVGRALSNLVVNALDHTPASSTVRIRADVEELTNAATFVVEDEGDGVPDVEKDRIFEPYATRGAGQRSGLGLGLSLVRALAQLHGGSVWVEDAPLRGAAFSLRIPER